MLLQNLSDVCKGIIDEEWWNWCNEIVQLVNKLFVCGMKGKDNILCSRLLFDHRSFLIVWSVDISPFSLKTSYLNKITLTSRSAIRGLFNRQLKVEYIRKVSNYVLAPEEGSLPSKVKRSYRSDNEWNRSFHFLLLD